MSRLGNEWSTLDGRVLQYRDRVLNEQVDTQRLPYAVQVDNLVYHSNIPKIMLSNQMIDLTQPLSAEHKALLRQTLPPTIADKTQQIQLDFKKETARKNAEARTKYFRETNAGRNKAFQMRYEQYLRDHPEARVFQDIVDALVKVGDFVIPLGAAVGMPTWMIDIYKKFAPPGSKFYTKGSLENKVTDFAKEQAKGLMNKAKAKIESIGKEKAGELGKELAKELNKTLFA